MYARIMWTEPIGRRRYRKLESIEDHKDFILEKLRLGTKHEVILAALRTEKGEVIKLNSFKRALGKWGLSGKNLTKARRQYIRKRLLERQRAGKNTVVKQRGRALAPEQIDDILGSRIDHRALKEGEIHDIEFITPRAIPEESTTRISEDMRMDESSAISSEGSEDITIAGDPPLETTGDFHSDSEPTICDEILHIAGFYEGPETGEDIEEPFLASNSPQETIEELQAVISDGIKNLSMPDDVFVCGPYDEDPRDLDPFSNSSNKEEEAEVVSQPTPVSKENAIRIDTTESIFENNFDAAFRPSLTESELIRGDELLDEKASMYEQDLQQYLKFWKKTATNGIAAMNKMARQDCLPMSNAETAAITYLRKFIGDPLEDVNYKFCEELLKDKIESRSTQGTRVSDLYSSTTLIERIRKKGLFRTLSLIELDISQDGGPSYGWMTPLFHLRRIIDQFGIWHIFTARAFSVAAVNLELPSYPEGECLRDQSIMVNEIALQIFHEIGMSHHNWALESLDWSYRYLKEQPYDSRIRTMVRQYVLQTCGPYDCRTIFVFSDLAVDMLNSNEQDIKLLGEYLGRLIIKTIDSPSRQKPHSSVEKWLFRAMMRLGHAFVVNQNHCLAIRLLEPVWKWEKLTTCQKKILQRSCDISLARSYTETGRYKNALEVLFAGYNMTQTYSRNPSRYAAWYFPIIAAVTYDRGPQLHCSLDPIFRDLAKKLRKVKETNPKRLNSYRMAWETWSSTWARNLEATKTMEATNLYENMLSAHPLRFYSTGTLQDYVYYQGVADWLYSQQISSDPEGISGWVDEFEIIGMDE